MAVALQITLEGDAKLRKWLRRLDLVDNPQIMRRGYGVAALMIQKNAARKQIRRGGGGKRNAAAVHPSRLTSRTGTLRGSIRVDRRGLPHSISVGSDLNYAAVHEFGGRVSVKASRVPAHQRTVAFGVRRAPFNVPSHTRKAHAATFPRRSFIKPAGDFVLPKLPGIFLKEWEREARRP